MIVWLNIVIVAADPDPAESAIAGLLRPNGDCPDLVFRFKASTKAHLAWRC